MEMREIDVVVGAATAFKALTRELREAIPTVSQNGNGLQDANLQFLEQRLLQPVHRADQLVNQMLAYAGAQSLEPTNLELLPFLADVAYSLLRALDVRIRVLVDVGHDCPPCLADANGLREALLNLVVNARDAMPEGGRIQLSARAAVAPDGSPAVAVAVADNGVGMAADFARRAVLPFVTTKTDSPYAGMGLAATDGFARQSGGRLELWCGTRGGLTATLFLPRAASKLIAVTPRDHLKQYGTAYGGEAGDSTMSSGRSYSAWLRKTWRAGTRNPPRARSISVRVAFVPRGRAEMHDSSMDGHDVRLFQLGYFMTREHSRSWSADFRATGLFPIADRHQPSSKLDSA